MFKAFIMVYKVINSFIFWIIWMKLKNAWMKNEMNEEIMGHDFRVL